MYVVPIGENATILLCGLVKASAFTWTPFSSWWKIPEPFSANHSYAVLQCGRNTSLDRWGTALGQAAAERLSSHSRCSLAEHHKVSVAGGPREGPLGYACGSEYSLERKDARSAAAYPLGHTVPYTLTLGYSQSQVDSIATTNRL